MRGKVVVAKSDGRYRRSLISSALESPSSIAVDPEKGKMYWADSGTIPIIETAWLDGTNRKILVSDAMGHPTGISIDFAMDHTIFWADTKLNTIESVKPDGSARQVLIRGDYLKHPVSLDVFESSVFWVTRDTGEVVRQDKFGRTDPVVLAQDLLNPSGVKGTQLRKSPQESSLVNFVFSCSVPRSEIRIIGHHQPLPPESVLAPLPAGSHGPPVRLPGQHQHSFPDAERSPMRCR